MKYVVISAKIPYELKVEIDKLGINISEVVRNALREAVLEKKLELIKKRKKEIRYILNKIPEERVIKSIREMREHA